jgi:hypothetical protein
MSLEMRAQCGKCGQSLGLNEEAYICSYECTFCEGCTSQTKHVCQNCGGELLRPPKRNVS